MNFFVGIDGEKVNGNIVVTLTVKGDKIDFLKFEIDEKNLEYVNLYNIPKEELIKMKKKICEMIDREIKVREIMGKEN